MFDLNYYNDISKTREFLQKDKIKGLSRAHLHDLQSKRPNKKQFWIDRINDIPQEDVRTYMLLTYQQKGEQGMVEVQKMLKEHNL